MFDALTRLYRTKLLLFCLLLTISGAALIAIGKRSAGSASWLSFLPLAEFGGILVGAGLLSVWLDTFLRREQAAIDERRLRHLLHDQAPIMRDAVLEAFAADHQDLARVSTPETLDRIITNSLGLRLGDQRFATEIYRDVHDQAVNAGERWHNASLSIDVAPLDDPGRRTKLDYFAVTVRWEYTTTPKHPQRRFACVGDRDEYSELTAEPGATSAWFLGETNELDPRSPKAFELLRFSVNGDERPIRRAERKSGQIYSANLGSDVIAAGQPVTIAYTYQVVTTRQGHLLFFDIEQPTRDLTIDFDYTGCDIATISTLDLVPSIRHTRIEPSPSDLPAQKLRVDIDGWIFPRSGIAFVWTLEAERWATRGRRPTSPSASHAHADR